MYEIKPKGPGFESFELREKYGKIKGYTYINARILATERPRELTLVINDCKDSVP